MPWGSSLFPLLIVTSSGKFTGLFVYSPGPGPDNLIASSTAQSGTDPFGNNFLAGDTVYGSFSGLFFALQMFDAGLQWYLGGTHQSAAYSPTISHGQGALNPGGPGAGGLVHLLRGSVVFADTGASGQQRHLIMAPSGDITGIIDLANINAAFATDGIGRVTLLPGTFYTNAPIVMNRDFQVFEGAGQPYATTIQSAATSPQTAMIVASGATAPLNAVTIRDMALKSSTVNSGHGIIFRSNNGLIENVNVQGAPGGDPFHLSLDALAATPVFDINMRNCYALQPGSTFSGYLLDANYNSCELYACRAQGGTGPASPGGTWGFQVFGTEIKLVDCHPFEFVNGGAVLIGNHNQVIGGEFETNGHGGAFGFGIRMDGSSGGGTFNRVIGASFYGNNAKDIQETAGADSNIYYGNTFASGTGLTLVGTHTVARDNPGFNPVGVLVPPVYASGTARTNTFGVPVTVHVAGSTAVAVNGTATGLATGTFHLQPGETITPTGAGGSWVWFGE